MPMPHRIAVHRVRPAARARRGRVALLYPLLVGLPTLGVLAILRVGEQLVASPALGGEWTVAGHAGAGAPDASAIVPVVCGGTAGSRPLARVEVIQSGMSAVVALRAPDGARWAAGAVAVRADGATGALPLDACSDAAVLATLDTDGTLQPRDATLTLGVRGCAACAPLRVRLARAARAGAGAAAGGH
jgi:hypothetical protein